MANIPTDQESMTPLTSAWNESSLFYMIHGLILGIMALVLILLVMYAIYQRHKVDSTVDDEEDDTSTRVPAAPVSQGDSQEALSSQEVSQGSSRSATSQRDTKTPSQSKE